MSAAIGGWPRLRFPSCSAWPARGRRPPPPAIPAGVWPWDDGWKAGHVHDVNGGANYDLDIDSVDGGQIRMRGDKGLRALGATLTLVRPTADLRLCATAVGA